MGLNFICSSSSYDEPKKYVNTEYTPLPNPDPSRYEIVQYVEKNNYLLVLVNYPNCTNYEGNKIMLYKGVTYKKLIAQKLLDPHFNNNNNFYSPIARFEPTPLGWIMGMKLMNKQL